MGLSRSTTSASPWRKARSSRSSARTAPAKAPSQGDQLISGADLRTSRVRRPPGLGPPTICDRAAWVGAHIPGNYRVSRYDDARERDRRPSRPSGREFRRRSALERASAAEILDYLGLGAGCYALDSCFALHCQQSRSLLPQFVPRSTQPQGRHEELWSVARVGPPAGRPGATPNAHSRASGERKYYLSNLPADVSLKTLAGAIKARWVCEQAHQQLKGRTRPRLLRRPILAWRAPPRAHDDDRLRLPAKPPPRRGERGKKESAKGRPSRHCPRSGAPCSPFSLARRHIDVPIAGEPSEHTSNKSAKVVLGRGLINAKP